MNLTEPQCGTDLGLLRTKAAPAGDGTYRITGQKIWISGGEHDLTENIVHLVLARIEGAPAGMRGISLFIVPKFIPDADGDPGARNAVVCVGLEEKMGIHGNATCVMAYDGATGWLVGEENRGLSLMFVMMNEARLGVGMQGLAQAEAAYQAAADLRQGPAAGPLPDRAQEPRRPGRPDHRPPRRAPDADGRPRDRRGRPRLPVLDRPARRPGPPPSRRGGAPRGPRLHGADDAGAEGLPHRPRLSRSARDAMQVHGGSGFTEHFPVSQYLRDCRIALIYEGTNGIQALDLVGRKLAANGGRGVMGFFAEIDAFIAANASDEATEAVHRRPGRRPRRKLQEATMWLMQNGLANPDNAGAASTDYLHLFGLTGLAYMWALMAKAAPLAIAGGATRSLLRRQARRGPLLHRPRAAGDRRPPRQAEDRRGP